MTINDVMTIKGLIGETVHRLYLSNGTGFGTQVLVDLDNDSEFLKTYGDNIVTEVTFNTVTDENGKVDFHIVRIVVDELML